MIRKFAWTIVVVGIFSGLLRGDEPAAPLAKEFVVHEWAVFVKGKDADGKAVLSSPRELVAGLPKFVQTVKEPHQVQSMPWKKPVLHLYGDEGLEVHIKVTADQGVAVVVLAGGQGDQSRYTNRPGREMEARIITRHRWHGMVGDAARQARGQIGGSPQGPLVVGRGEAPSMYFVADKECERFLFYEATAQQEPTVLAGISADQFKLTNSDGNAAGEVMVIVSSGEQLYCRVLETIEAGGEATISKADFLAKAFRSSNCWRPAEAHWRQFGMTAAEAKAIVASAAERPAASLAGPGDLAHAAGLYDKMFPLTVSPKPDKLVRVGMVFDRLTGKACANIVPGLSDHIKDMRQQAKSQDQTKSKPAKAALDELGVEE